MENFLQYLDLHHSEIHRMDIKCAYNDLLTSLQLTSQVDIPFEFQYETIFYLYQQQQILLPLVPPIKNIKYATNELY